MSCGTPELALLDRVRLRGCHPLWQAFPKPFCFAVFVIMQVHDPRAYRYARVWALPRSLATTKGIDRFLSLPPGNKMFQFPGFPSVHY